LGLKSGDQREHEDTCMLSFLLQTSLIGFRLLPIFVVTPIASMQRVPITVRILITLAIAMTLSKSYSADHQALLNGYALVFAFGGELLIGISLAFSFHAATAAMQTLGQLIDLQIGFSAGSVFDPNTEQTISPTGELLTLMLLVSLVSFNVHHDLLIGFAKFLTILPPGSAVIWSENWLLILGSQFTLGFIIVSPIILTLWFTDITLAFISKSLPQAQVYFVGLPVKVMIGILVLAWFSNQAAEPLYRLLQASLNSWAMMFVP